MILKVIIEDFRLEYQCTCLSYLASSLEAVIILGNMKRAVVFIVLNCQGPELVVDVGFQLP